MIHELKNKWIIPCRLNKCIVYLLKQIEIMTKIRNNNQAEVKLSNLVLTILTA